MPSRAPCSPVGSGCTWIGRLSRGSRTAPVRPGGARTARPAARLETRPAHPHPSGRGTKQVSLSYFSWLKILWASSWAERHFRRVEIRGTPGTIFGRARWSFHHRGIAAVFLSWNDDIVLAPRRLVQSEGAGIPMDLEMGGSADCSGRCTWGLLY